jgi:hypothetical protein
MNNAVEGVNYATKKSDMSAKPKDNMDTADTAMQNHSNLKSYSRKSSYARDLNAEPLYVQDGYGHKVLVLKELRTKARHMIIRQFKGK